MVSPGCTCATDFRSCFPSRTTIASEGASASSRFTLRIEGVNRFPLAVDDELSVGEDAGVLAIETGALLANDSDPDRGDAIAITGVGGSDSGIPLVWGNGQARYEFGDRYQSLAAGQEAFDRFRYTIADASGATSDATVELRIVGANDAPVLVAPLADRQLRAGETASWQLPPAAFADIDAGDRLTFTATLADGAPLPDWLSFAPATQTFSARAPAGAGSIDVRVVAGDGNGNGPESIASDVFRVSVAHGNAGVGNGEDPPPPGHGCDFNDGPGTEPGRPGSRGGKRRGEERHGAGDDDDGYGRRQPADGRGGDWLARWGEGEHGGNYLDCRLLDRHRHSPEDKQAQRPGQGSETGRRWAEIERALGRLAFDSELPGGRERAHGAETRHLATADPFRALRSNGVEGVSLATGSGTCLKGFRGLHEGLRQIA